MKFIKNIIIISGLTLTLGGCAFDQTKPDLPPATIVKNQLVFVTVPSELFDVPANVDAWNADGTQKDVASWLTNNEKRTELIENKMIQLRNYFANTYDLLKSQAGDNVIIIDSSQSDEFNKTTVKAALDKPIVPPETIAPPVETKKTEDKGIADTVKGWFKSDPKPVAPVKP